ncbi:hypothetical protein D9M70_395190 [compost metagenome]
MACAKHIDWPGVQVAGAIRACHDERAGAVGHQAAITHRQRIRHHLGMDDVIDAQRIAQERVWIALRPLPRRHRHFGQLRARSAVLVHMPRRGQRIAGDWIERLVGMLVWLRIEFGAHRIDPRAARDAARIAAVADQHVVALAGLDRHGGNADIGDKGRTAEHRAIGEAGPDAQVFRHPHHPPRRGQARRDDAIDVGHAQPAGGHGAMRGLRDDFLFRTPARMPEPGQAGAQDGHATTVRCFHHGSPTGANTSNASSPVRLTSALTRSPILTAEGSVATTLLIRRGPSSRSTRQTL